ncbi:uncharacterized protein N7503_009362 [Penicillium pulvis]|uniref:uncharacterized protein n=1 Tax=Penicillium pulvis TaxID=1562058 RepID=UPI00254689BA|nr:uncharacterized protein N7503_009362 [Penicillium pulvis]KAJ5793384.1 hypothetical protein N7503_009362 [Penicillium pulvis]
MLEILPSSALDDGSLSDITPTSHGEQGVTAQNFFNGYATHQYAISRVMLASGERKGTTSASDLSGLGATLTLIKEALMRKDEYGILQWQVILGRPQTSPQATLQI